MDDKTKRLIDNLVRYMACVQLLRNSKLTKRQHEGLWELTQKVESILEELLQHLESTKEAG